MSRCLVAPHGRRDVGGGTIVSTSELGLNSGCFGPNAPALLALP